MTSLLKAPLPASPAVDWPALEREHGWLRELADCPQEPVHHGEGDVLTHTKLVVEALLEDPDWRALDEQGRLELYLAALLHDVGKSQTTRVEDGRVVSPGHSRRGAIMARRLLWEAGLEPHARERVCGLIRGHMAPYFLVVGASQEPEEARRRALALSLTADCARLHLLARADARGRISETAAELSENVELFAAYCDELGCLRTPFPFPSDHSRFLYFRREGRDPSYHAYDDTRSRVTMLHGLPGAGKDTYVERELAEAPVVSLDGIRKELKVSATDNQGAVLQLAKERCREHLRQGADFVWNSTVISRSQREPLLGLFADYDARVDIVQVEVAASRHGEQNRARGASAVPDAAIERMLYRWEPPDLTECHTLTVAGP